MTGFLRRGFTRRDAWRTSAAYATGLSAIAGFGLPAFAQSEDADKIVAEMVAANPDKFNLSKIPEITNKDKITVVVESGFCSDYLKSAMIPKFTEKTGVEVEVVGMSTNVMYAKQQVELLGDTGGYAGYFKALARQSVTGLWLTGVSVSGGGRDIGIRGRTTDPATVPGYLARLTGEPLMQGKSFASLSISQPAKVDTAGADGKPDVAAVPWVEFSLQSVPEESRK